MVGTVAVVATLDTKGTEIGFLKDRIEESGCKALVIDMGIFEPEGITPDVSRHEIAAAAGSSISRLIAGGRKILAFGTMSQGVARKIDELYKAGRFQAIMTVAGGTGTHLIAEKANRARRAPTFVLPSGGWSAVDAPEKPFYDPELNGVFISKLKSLLSPQVRVIDVAAHINDEACARTAVDELHRQFEDNA